MRAVIYTRVSTDRQADEGYSLDEQERSCHERIDREGWTHVHTFPEAGVSGKLASRPQLDKLLSRLDDMDVIVVYALDRLGRSTKNLLELWERCEAADVKLVFVRESIDTSTPAGRMMRTVLCAVAELEREQISDRTKSALAARRRSGEQVTGRAPYGATWTDDKTLGENPSESAVIHRICRDHLAGQSQGKVARALNAEGVPTREGGRWTQARISEILSRRVVVNGQPLVDDETQAKIELIRRRHAKTGGRQPSTHILTNGMLRCGHCGGAMLPREGNRPSPKYVCKTRLDLGAEHCSMPPVPMRAVDDPLREALAEGYFDVEKTLTAWQESRSSELVLAQEAHDHTEQEAVAIDRRLAKVQRGWQDEVLSDGEYAAQRTDLADEQAGAAAALQQAESRVEALKRDVAESDVQPVLDALIALKTADLDEFRRILRTMFESFVLVPVRANGTPADWTHIPTGPGEGAEVADGSFYLMPRLRVEFVDGDLDVIRQPLPAAHLATTDGHSSQWR